MSDTEFPWWMVIPFAFFIVMKGLDILDDHLESKRGNREEEGDQPPQNPNRGH